MKSLIQTLAIGAALVAVAIGVWRDYGAVLTLKRAAVAYLAVYFVAGVIYLAARSALRAVQDPAPSQERADRRWAKKRSGSGKMPTPMPRETDTPAVEPADSRPETVDAQTSIP